VKNSKKDASNSQSPQKEGGHSCPPIHSPSPFFNPRSEIKTSGDHLPHWQQEEVWIFLTWRLADSLPVEKVNEMKAERTAWLSRHPKPWSEADEFEYHERFSRRFEDWLDQGMGSCLLRKPGNGRIVADAITHFRGERYDLDSFVIMPNHVHVLFRPFGNQSLEKIVQSWKGFSAREINRRSGRSGTLWQENYWDRLVRNERHLYRIREYIRENPVKAGLERGEFIHECWGTGSIEG